MNRFARTIFFAYLTAVLVSGLLAGKAILDNRRIANEAHRGLCTLKHERERRVLQTEAILAHPDTEENSRIIRSLGLSILVRSLETARGDVQALEDVSC